MRRTLLALVAAATLVGCGDGQSGLPEETAPTTTLTISVVADRGADATVMKLTCDPAGGDHPNAEAACAKLAEAGAAIFEPVPTDRACTMIFGGPQTATITGTYQGEKVDAAFSRTNGCELDRWDTLGTEVFDVPML